MLATVSLLDLLSTLTIYSLREETSFYKLLRFTQEAGVLGNPMGKKT